MLENLSRVRFDSLVPRFGVLDTGVAGIGAGLDSDEGELDGTTAPQQGNKK